MTQSTRYHSLIIGFHWLMALVIIGLIAAGKYMTSLAPEDPARYQLTQLHKSFGIVILLLSGLRLVARFTTSAPSLPAGMAGWEKQAARVTHVALYLAMLLVPLTGWWLVSVSPLNLQTVLFGILKWPHLGAPGGEALAERASSIHELLANLLLLLLVLHVLAALKHQFIVRDNLFQRLSFFKPDGRADLTVAAVILAFAAIVGSAILVGNAKRQTSVIQAGNGVVTITLISAGLPVEGTFGEAMFDLSLGNTAADTRLNATVQTSTLVTGDPQIDMSITDPDWLDSNNYPAATFTSTALTQPDADSLEVSGELSIKDRTRPLSLTLAIDRSTSPATASGAFVINRMDFDIGKLNQPDDSNVGYNVDIGISFELQEGSD